MTDIFEMYNDEHLIEYHREFFAEQRDLLREYKSPAKRFDTRMRINECNDRIRRVQKVARKRGLSFAGTY